MLKKTCIPGETIFREGDESTEAYWIISGSVEITIRSGDTGMAVARLGPGEIIGEMGLIDDKPRSATATAVAPTELELVTEADFEKDVLQNPHRLRTYLGRLFERLRGADTLLELERARHADAAVTSAVNPPESSESSGPEPVINIKSMAPNPVTSKIIEVCVDRFPFRVGRASGDKWSLFFQNELMIEDKKPHQISRQHASIDRCSGCKCIVTDRGSRTGTVVNGVHLGVGAKNMTAELKLGDNLVIFGHPVSSPHRYTIHVSAGS